MLAAPSRMPLPPKPARVRRFRLGIAKMIPKSPNDRATKQVLEEKGLGALLIDYMNWRARFVGVRKRKVVIAPEMLSQPNWAEHAAAVEALFKRVERGDDLTPHLSLEPHGQGYALRAGKQGASSEDKWADKDFLLHATNYHHFHLGQKIEKERHVERTDDLLFAEVTREEFRAVGIFDHSVFELASPERIRLGQIRHRIAFRGKPPGVVMIDAAIQSSGHTLHGVHYAMHCANKVREIEPRLDDPAFVKSMFSQASGEAPTKPKFLWGFDHLDIGVLERTTGQPFLFSKGWN